MQQDTLPTPEPTPSGGAPYQRGDLLREMFRLKLAWADLKSTMIIGMMGLVIAMLIGFIMVLLALLFSMHRLAAVFC